MTSYRELRHHDELGGIDKNHMNKNPFIECQKWINHAIDINCYQPNAMVLATVNQDQQPSTRIVLLKDLTEDGLVFYTNYDSQKAQDIDINNKVALHFYWDSAEQQIRIEGTIAKTSKDISDDYFSKRPKESNLGAIASPQSREITSREWLEQNFQQLEQQFKDQEVSRPDNWGGYNVKPNYFEFWQGRPNRLHDRICYRLQDSEWIIARLAP